MTSPRLVIISIAVSGASLLVAVFAILFALSPRGADSGAPLLVEPESIELTADNPAFAVPHAEGLYSIFGTVSRVESGSVYVQAGQDEESFKIDETTMIVREGARKDSAAYEQEIQEFHETLRHAIGASEIFIVPSPFEIEMASLSDLAPGTPVEAFVGTDGYAVQVVIQGVSQ